MKFYLNLVQFNYILKKQLKKPSILFQISNNKNSEENLWNGIKKDYHKRYKDGGDDDDSRVANNCMSRKRKGIIVQEIGLF